MDIVRGGRTPVHAPGGELSADNRSVRDLGRESAAVAGWAFGIGLVALALRLAVAWQFTGDPLGQMAWIDEEAYWERGREILAGSWLPNRPFYQDPLYPYLLAGLMRVFGTDLTTLRLVLASLGALTPVAVFCAGWKGLGRTEGIVAGLAAALYAPLVFTDVLFEKEGLGALFAALALALTALAASRPHRTWPAGLSGLAWGLLALLRSNALLVGPLGVAWWVLGVPDGRGRSHSWRAALGFAAGFTLALAPVVVVNAVVSRPPELIVTTWQAGANFYIGNGPEATGIINAPDFVFPHPFLEADDYAAEAERRVGRSLSPGQVSRFWFGEGLRRWREAPGSSLRLLAKKFGLLLNNYEISDNQNFDLARFVAAPALGWCILSFGWLVPWAALGLGCERRARTPFWWFVGLSTLAGLASTAAFFVVGRYRIPWVPGLALLAAAGVLDTARRVRRGLWRSLIIRVAILAAPAVAIAWSSTPIPADERWGHGEKRLFIANLRAGKLESAIDALDDGRALGPRPMGFLNGLVSSGPELQQLRAAVRLRLNSRQRLRGTSDLIRARWLRVLPEGRAESRRLLETALRASPEDRGARREWGAWWLGADDPDARRRATEEIRRAAEGPSGDPSAAILLALLTSDPGPLDLPALRKPGPRAPRLRLARAIVAEQAGRPLPVNNAPIETP